MTKRLKYTKDILTHMLNNNTHNTNTGRNGGAGQSIGGSITPGSSSVGGAGATFNNVAQSQNIYPGSIPHSAATGKRSEMLGTMSQGFGINGQDFGSLAAGSSINIPQSAGLGSHRRPLNILNN
jgi:hypothetical protein